MSIEKKGKPLEYSAKDIQWQKGLQGIRKRPEMYIHSVDSQGVWTLAREAADNAADENSAGRNPFVHICQDTDDSIWIIDHGTGIPVGPYIDPETKKKDGRTTLEIILSETHAGGKFGSKAYKGSRGTHGVGVKATNALSSMFQVWTCYQNAWWFTEFSRGKIKTAPKKSKPPKLPHGAGTAKKGTVVRFIPDDQIFHKGSKFLPQLAAQWCELTAYMQAGFKTKLTDKKGKTQEWFFKNGSKEYLDKRIAKLQANQMGKDCLIQEGCYTIAVAFTDYDGVGLEGFTNGLANPDGGTHIDTFYRALTKALEPHRGKAKYNPSDLREGIVGFINVRLDEPKFGSQTKEKLVDETPKNQFDQLAKALVKFFNDNKTLAKRLCQRAAELKSLKDQFVENKKVLKELSGAARKGKSFAVKHSRCDCPAELRELFLVEGDSAGGCFVATTKVRLADGTTKTLSELVDDDSKGHVNIGLSFNLTTGEFEPFQIESPRITKYVTELVELTLESGEVVRCTPDHQFLLESGVYKAAKDLTDVDLIKEYQPVSSTP